MMIDGVECIIILLNDIISNQVYNRLIKYLLSLNNNSTCVVTPVTNNYYAQYN